MLLLRRAGVCVLSHTCQLFKSGEIHQPTPLKRQTSWKRSCSRPDWETCFGGYWASITYKITHLRFLLKLRKPRNTHTHRIPILIPENMSYVRAYCTPYNFVLYAIWFACFLFVDYLTLWIRTPYFFRFVWHMILACFLFVFTLTSNLYDIWFVLYGILFCSFLTSDYLTWEFVRHIFGVLYGVFLAFPPREIRRIFAYCSLPFCECLMLWV